jgi:multicomponent Na+:H+ antiporter subunit E
MTGLKRPADDSTRLSHDLPDFWRRFASRLLLFGLVWLGLNGLDLRSWWIGGPVMTAVAWQMAKRRGSSPRLRWSRLPAFAAYFLRESVYGGWDVARRVWRRRLPVNPGFVQFTTLLPDGPARHWFLNVISLLPGTLSAGLEGDRIMVHALDTRTDTRGQLRALESRVGGLWFEEVGR